MQLYSVHIYSGDRFDFLADILDDPQVFNKRTRLRRRGGGVDEQKRAQRVGGGSGGVDAGDRRRSDSDCGVAQTGPAHVRDHQHFHAADRLHGLHLLLPSAPLKRLPSLGFPPVHFSLVDRQFRRFLSHYPPYCQNQ